MTVHGIFLIMITILFASALPVVQVPTISPPPVVTTISDNERATRLRNIVVLKPVSGQCGDGVLDFSRIERPIADLLWSTDSNLDQLVSMSFRIDESGRPLGIKRDPAAYGMAEDLAPSLAASRFAPGVARDGCAIVYRPKRSSIADADPSDLIGYSIFGRARSPKEVFDRIMPASLDCNTQRPAVLLRAFPDFEKIPATAGRFDWSMVQFDVDASGKPVRLSTFGTTGNKALDRASLQAAAQSRFAKGAKQGCIYPYSRKGGTLAAPQSKELDAYRSEDSNCPQTVTWKNQPALVYPESFRKRSIEGWAIIAFDLAPWGAVGNARVIAAEPAAEFGASAQRIVVGSSTAPTTQGFSNCLTKVRYTMRKQDSETVTNID